MKIKNVLIQSAVVVALVTPLFYFSISNYIEIQKMKNDINNNTIEIQSLKNDIANISQNIDNLESNITSLENKTNGISSDISQLSDTQKQDKDSLEKTTQSIKLRIVELDDYLSALSKVQKDLEDSVIEEIRALINSLETLKLRVDVLAKQQKVEWLDSGFNYLAIGNSITIHEICSYWWDEHGMAASTKEKDFVHLVTTKLEETNTVQTYAVNFAEWENQYYDRAETLKNLDVYLSDKVDLITIQLSENVNNFDTYKSDYEDLITYVQAKATGASIIMIDDFWSDGTKSTQKKEVADNNGIPFVDLSSIKGVGVYQCGLGTTVYDVDGNPHTVEHAGVAGHPGDEGMKYIADGIIAYL